MKDSTISFYCFVDDLLLKLDNKSIDKRRNFQVITTVTTSAKYLYDNQLSACSYLESHHGANLPDKRNGAVKPLQSNIAPLKLISYFILRTRRNIQKS